MRPLVLSRSESLTASHARRGLSLSEWESSEEAEIRRSSSALIVSGRQVGPVASGGSPRMHPESRLRCAYCHGDAEPSPVACGGFVTEGFQSEKIADIE